MDCFNFEYFLILLPLFVREEKTLHIFQSSSWMGSLFFPRFFMSCLVFSLRRQSVILVRAINRETEENEIGL